MYKLVKDHIGTIREGKEVIADTILRKADNAFIPKSTTNRYYVEYLEWVEAGNTPEAADAGPTDWDIARAKRDTLLKDSDWTMITGATVDQAQWSAYREKLRDIPQTYKGKETSEIVWPTAPSTKGPNS